MLPFKQSWLNCVVRGHPWRSDDKLKGIQERFDGCVKHVMVLLCELCEGEKIP